MAPLGPFGPAPRVAIGVSGGPHSLALMFLASEWARARGGEAHALIVDHGLRPGSDAEAAWAACLLRAQGMPAEILTLSLPPGAAVQERARAGRMAAMLGRCDALGLPWLLLGQHRSDQAETVLFRALRGSGDAGLAGMSPVRAEAAALLLRPLLGVAPARLEALLTARGIVPLRDPSNTHPRFARARLRAALADADGLGPGIVALAEAGAAFGRRRARAAKSLTERLAEAVRLRPEGYAWLDAKALGTDRVARLALASLLRLLSGEEHAPAEDAVAAFLERGGGTLHGVQWSGDRLYREPAACAPAIPAVPGAVWDGRWQVVEASAGLTIGAFGAASSALERRERGGMSARILAGLPALWRGETLQAVPPLGIGGTGEVVFAPRGGPLS
ncbi:tRNA(Ile)-lysidine synthetase [Acetobacteraceae bacterium AT-5844]|nr:tRNA(Ile)-lysidine synthetase [Acetobacteraceae bacterium AT-5844]